MSKHIGIVACSAEGAALCYRTICAEGASLLGEYDHPEVSMHTFSLRSYMDALDIDDWDSVAKLMIESASKLASIGAEFAICPDNTIHQAFESVTAKSKIPWLHIADEVAKVAQSRGYKKVGVLGTKFLMEGPVYPKSLKKFGIDSQIPDSNARQKVHDVIFSELVCGVFSGSSRSSFGHVIEDLQKKHGCDAVILGCTEIPLLVSQEDSTLPVLDSTRILARAALNYAIQAQVAERS